MGAIKVADRIWLIGRGSWGGHEPLSAGESGNVYLVDCGGALAVIDSGVPDGVEDVIANIRSAGLDPGKVKLILATHFHGDHVAGLSALAEKTKARVVGSIALERALEGELEETRLWVERTWPDPSARPAVEGTADGEVVKCGATEFKVIETPGHTPTCATFAFEDGGRTFAFTGDCAIGDQPGAGEGLIGWMDGHWGADPWEIEESLVRLLALAPDMLLPGHGLPIEGRASVMRSLARCVWRARTLTSIPALGSMMPLRRRRGAGPRP